MKYVFSSDTYPNKWFPEYAKDADSVIHECFIALEPVSLCKCKALNRVLFWGKQGR
jgi:hypothetical protein